MNINHLLIEKQRNDKFYVVNVLIRIEPNVGNRNIVEHVFFLAIYLACGSGLITKNGTNLILLQSAKVLLLSSIHEQWFEKSFFFASCWKLGKIIWSLSRASIQDF